MAELSAERLAHLAYDLELIDERQLESLRSELGRTSDTPDEFRQVATRLQLLTNYQVDRVLKKERTGYFYGDYKVLYLVGTGTFARVYRATHRKKGGIYAVKVLRKRFRTDAEQVELFLREGEVGLLLRHPGVVPVYEVNTDPAAPYFVMDFVEGQSLRDFVKIRKKLTAEEALRLITDVVGGLAYAAQQGIFHRDLKLSNVLVTSAGKARLVDFGLYGTRAADNSAGDTPNARTIDYVALERATGVKKNDPRSDIFFAGCMFYHLLTGQSPLAETKDRLQRLSATRYREIKPIVELEPTLHRSLVGVVGKAMELDPERRYQNPAELLADLQLAARRMESPEGDLSESVAATPAKPAARAAEQEGVNHTVMIVESNTDVQNILRDKLKKHGYRVLVISDPERALDRFDEDHPPAECVVFCTDVLGELAVDAFNRLGDRERTSKIPAMLVVDEHQNSLANMAQLNSHRVLLRMPLKVREIRSTIRSLLGIPKSDDGQ